MLALTALLSLLVGALLGLLGGGGSMLTLPLLRYVLGLPTHDAVATTLVVVACTSAVALVPHARRGHVRFRIAGLFGGAGMIGAYTAGRWAGAVPDAVLLGLFGALMLAAAGAMLRRPRRVASTRAEGRRGPAPRSAAIAAQGLGVGAVTGLVGAGGGFVVVPALVLLGGVPIADAIGTSLAVIALQSSAALAGHLGHATLDARVVGVVTAACVAGSLGGGVLSARVSPDRLRVGFGLLVVFMACVMLAAELPAALGHPLPGLAAAGLAGAVTALIALARGATHGAEELDTRSV